MVTGFRDLDSLIGGYFAGELVLIDGEPGVGKSAFALNTALQAAQHNQAAAIFNYQASEEQVLRQLMSMLTSVPVYAMASGQLNREDWPELFLNVRNPVLSRLHILGSANLTPEQMEAYVRGTSEVRVRQGKDPLSLVVADPLRLMGSATPAASEDQRRRQLATVVLRLKKLARNLHVPVLLVGTLDGTDHRSRGEPSISSELDALQAARNSIDKVLFLRTGDEAGSPEETGKAEIVVAKHRGGPTGRVGLVWREVCGSFHSLPKRPVSSDR
jgi:replicative DNA helicase